jgi:hypothetical protein
MNRVRKLGIIISAAAIGATALTGALWASAAHAQPAASISLTSSTLGGTVGSGYYPVLTFSVTCPVGDDAYAYATVSEGTIATGESSFNAVKCTGDPQSVTVPVQTGVPNSPPDMAASQAFVGATLILDAQTYPLPAPNGPAASLAEFTTIG